MMDLYQAALLFDANLGELRRHRPGPWDLDAPVRARRGGGSRLAGLLRLGGAKKGGAVRPE